ncbi:MAG: zinc ribbon domain-containing protein [Bacteroidetes bacterium]|jgi:putative FmdB family regulatory protein|nr:zinc ribbon domain-containing protein [Bacteroidota bacterium]
MPTYEYKREDGTTFEVFQSMSDDALTVCPTTGQPVKRVISGGSGLVFKGSGFYVTDYKNGKSAGNSSSSEKESRTTSSDSSDNASADTSSKTKAND